MTSSTELHIWEASNSGGQPLCIGDHSDEPGSLSVSLYVDSKGVLRGAEVWAIDDDGELRPLTFAGEFPAAMLEELVERPLDAWFSGSIVTEAYEGENNGKN